MTNHKTSEHPDSDLPMRFALTNYGLRRLTEIERGTPRCREDLTPEELATLRHLRRDLALEPAASPASVIQRLTARQMIAPGLRGVEFTLIRQPSLSSCGHLRMPQQCPDVPLICSASPLLLRRPQPPLHVYSGAPAYSQDDLLFTFANTMLRLISQ